MFLGSEGDPLNRDACCLKPLIRLGAKAGVRDCHPHRFRHTFAINFLRNGGNVFQLQMAAWGTRRYRWCRPTWRWHRPI